MHLLVVYANFPYRSVCFFFFNDTATTEIYTLSLHDALPICASATLRTGPSEPGMTGIPARFISARVCALSWKDRKSTRLNSSHLVISYAVFCLKKKKNRCERMRKRQWTSAQIVR